MAVLAPADDVLVKRVVLRLDRDIDRGRRAPSAIAIGGIVTTGIRRWTPSC